MSFEYDEGWVNHGSSKIFGKFKIYWGISTHSYENPKTAIYQFYCIMLLILINLFALGKIYFLVISETCISSLSSIEWKFYYQFFSLKQLMGQVHCFKLVCREEIREHFFHHLFSQIFSNWKFQLYCNTGWLLNFL